MNEFFKNNGKTIALVLSLLLNALGGSGVIPPVTSDPRPCLPSSAP